MKRNELINKIRAEYLKAKNPIIVSPKLTRGTSHTISSYAEDIFAKFIADQCHKQFSVWIDPQISIKALPNTTGKRKLLFRPDICVVNNINNCIQMIFDLKMDLGYKRNSFIKEVKAKLNELNVIKKHEAECSIKPNTKLFFSNKISWNYIIISGGNISVAQRQKILNDFKDLKPSKIFILVDGHLNDQSANYKPIINTNDFKNLKLELSKNL